jgi:hypothetical protein
MLQFLASQAAESNAFSVPDRGAEDDLLVQVVPKYSTSDVLGHDWSEVASDLTGRPREECKERYRLPDTRLTFVFLCVTFRGSPFLLAESATRLMYLRVYDIRVTSRQSAPSPSLCYSVITTSTPRYLSPAFTLPVPRIPTNTCTQVHWLSQPQPSTSG